MMTVRRSLLLSFAQRYSDLALRLAGTVVLARLLTPAEMGVFAVGYAVIGLATVLAEFGLRTYLIQERELTEARRGAAFAIALAASWSVALALLGGVQLLRQAGLDPALVEVLGVLALLFLIQPLTLPAMALLQRRMLFGHLYIANTARAAVGVAAAVLLASLGFGFMSLAWASLAEGLCTLAFAIAYGRTVPWTRPRLAGWRPVLAFGRRAAAIGAMKQLGDAAPSLALGNVAGYAAAGLFTRAQGVVALFDRGVLQAIAPVVLPVLAARARKGQDLRPIYLRKVAYLAGTAWPFFAFVGLFAEPLVGVLLGGQWDAAVPVVRLLCLTGLLLPFNQMNLQFFIALDMLASYLRIQAVNQAVKIPLVVALAFVAFEAVALALVAEQLLKLLQTAGPLKRRLGYDRRALLDAVGRSAGVAAAALVLPLALLLGLPSAPAPVALALGVVGFGLGWLAGLMLTAHPLRGELARGLSQMRSLLQPA